MPRIQISFSEEEYNKLATAADNAGVPLSQFCKDMLLMVSPENMETKPGSFKANYENLLLEVEKYVKEKKEGFFQLRDIPGWAATKQVSFDGSEICNNGQKAALGRSFYTQVVKGLVKNVRIAMTTNRKGEYVKKLDKYGVVIYEIYREE